MKQYRRKQSKNVDCYFWTGLKFPKIVPNWIRGSCRVVIGMGRSMTLIINTPTGIAKAFKPCWIVRSEDNNGASVVSVEDFKRDYFEVII